MNCPVCGAILHWDSDVSYEDRGLEGDGIVSFLHCVKCGCDIELYMPEDNPYIDKNALKRPENSPEETA